jgi:hypothetical protein
VTIESTVDSLVRLAILEMYLAGKSPTVETVSLSLTLDAGETASAFDRLAAKRAIVLTPGTRDILMAAPFAGKPTDHRVRVGDRVYHANCIWDALGVPAMLAGDGRPADATIETTCVDCSQSLMLEVSQGTVTARPDGVVAHFAVPAARWWEDIVFT